MPSGRGDWQQGGEREPSDCQGSEVCEAEQVIRPQQAEARGLLHSSDGELQALALGAEAVAPGQDGGDERYGLAPQAELEKGVQSALDAVRPSQR